MRALVFGVAIVLFASVASAAEVAPSASERFAAEDLTEIPSFQRHVLPLLGRLGCNGRACHGSFQGQGGLRLSLFGYDFDSDHAALLGGDEPRTDLKTPAESLILLKPTKSVAHKGGKRMEVRSWEYRLIRKWVESGAPRGEKEATVHFARLDLEPQEIVFAKAGETRQLKVTAVWSDGSREDVTPLCRFRTNDESIAAIDENGRITSAGPGDTAVVAFYDNGVAPAQVILPVSDRSVDRYPVVKTSTKIDELVVAKLRKLGVVPSEQCTDEEFLRRVSLDLTGTLPSASDVTAFLADRSPDKRTKKIDALLASPAYAAWWATRLCDWTGNSEANGPLGGEQGMRRQFARAWYDWVHARVRDNVPYDRIVEGLVMARGRQPAQSYEEYCAEMGGYFRKDNPADFAARETMPYYWTRRPVGSSEEKALSFAWSFLGVSLQCAQCHKHPYDQWTKQDFDQFTAFFDGMRYGGGSGRDQVAAMKKAVGLEGDEDSGAFKRAFVSAVEAGKLVPWKELVVPNPPKPGTKARPKVAGGRVITPKLLGGDEVMARDFPDARQPLMDWVRQAENPYFARAFVNRVWATYFNVGLIDPPDDLNLANPPSNPALLDYLADGFVASGYDMKWLHRTIATSDTYQRSWRPNATNRLDERNFSRAVPRRLPAEVAYDAIVLATASDAGRSALDRDPAAARMIGVQSCFTGGRDVNNYAVTLFGKPQRVINCDCERSAEPTLLQTIYMRNDPEIAKLIDRKDGWLKENAARAAKEPDAVIRDVYLRTLSRPPSDAELATAREHLKASRDPASGLRDVLWTLMNTKEFIVNR